MGATDFYLNSFIGGLDLQVGVFVYGFIVWIVTTKLTADFEMTWYFYIYWTIGLIPYGTVITTLAIKSL
jgi:hypothetical protein